MEMMNKNMALVVEEIESMSDDEFQLQLDQHIGGDIANALLETGDEDYHIGKRLKGSVS